MQQSVAANDIGKRHKPLCERCGALPGALGGPYCDGCAEEIEAEAGLDGEFNSCIIERRLICARCRMFPTADEEAGLCEACLHTQEQNEHDFPLVAEVTFHEVERVYDKRLVSLLKRYALRFGYVFVPSYVDPNDEAVTFPALVRSDDQNGNWIVAPDPEGTGFLIQTDNFGYIDGEMSVSQEQMKKLLHDGVNPSTF